MKKTNKQEEEFYQPNGRIEGQSFSSDIEGKYFSWEEVQPCLGNVLARENFEQYDSCPKCNLPSEKLIWIDCSSSQKSWNHLAGRGGPLSICPHCKIQVEFLCYRMS